mmetsp:Transcript_23765/g.47286  ORF Transcript_23765/g.47286 Transcript_23765/m.47286 type:complete len:272 (-) Transcript_23765:35-850(-)
MKLPAVITLAMATTTSASLCDEDSDFVVDFFDTFDNDELGEVWAITEGNELGQLRDTWGTSDNVVVEDGKLELWSRREESHGYSFTSAALTTKDNRSWRPPFKACVKAQLPGSGVDGQMDGIWPAHWLMPQNQSCWPDLGEIDIMEQIDGQKEIYGTYHWNPNSTACSNHHDQAQSFVDVSDALNTYHEYGVHVEANYIDFYVDNKKVGRVDSSTVGDKLETHPQLDPTTAWYMILNTAVSNKTVWGEPVNDNTAFPVVHLVDYVKVLTKR